MSQPRMPMDPEQQEQLVRQIGRALLGVVPPDWQRLRAEYRAAGRHIEVDVLFSGPDQIPRPIRPPLDVVGMLGELRSGMYLPDRGTWLSAVYELAAPSSFSVNYDADNEPPWRNVPPLIGFQDELRMFPRSDELIPNWLRQRVGLPPLPTPGQPRTPTPPQETAAVSPQETAAQQGTAQPDEQGAPLRNARVFDGVDESGRPVINRPPVADEDRERILGYLEGAPIVLAARSYDTDALAPNEPAAVPLTFRTDGSWIWAGSVAYYLRKHDLAPEPDLLAHIRGQGFQLPEVDDATKDLAVTIIAGQPLPG
jgi:hypothetical protein